MTTFHRNLGLILMFDALAYASGAGAVCAQTVVRPVAVSTPAAGGCSVCGGGQGWSGPQITVATTAIGNSNSVGFGDGGGTVTVNQTSGPVLVYAGHGGVGGGWTLGQGVETGLSGGLVSVGANGAASGNSVGAGGVSTGNLGAGGLTVGANGVNGSGANSPGVGALSTGGGLGNAPVGAAVGGLSNGASSLAGAAANGALNAAGTLTSPTVGVGVGVGGSVSNALSAATGAQGSQPAASAVMGAAGALQLCASCLGGLNGGVGG